MLSRLRTYFIVAILLLQNISAHATHIVGGDLNYAFLGNNDYEITLKIYRDCFNGLAPFDNPASIGVFDSNNNLVMNLLVNISSQGNIANQITSPCLVPPTNVCYEYAEYITTVNLPPLAGGYQLVYQRCCRNGTIVNLQNVTGVGATYVATIPDQANFAVNSNPVFTNLPPTFICQNAPFHFDHSAVDADGDSLVYEMCFPLDGGSTTNPMPQPPNNPPYVPVVFQPPYSMLDPLGGVPMTIDAINGELTATPNNLGQFVYGVCCKEYRNGVLVSTTMRDFQANVVPCPNITIASIFSPTISCGSLTADFINNSFNALNYKWFFGDPTTLADSSAIPNPSYTYPDTGIYYATLIAYSPLDSNCTDTAIGEVRVYPDFTAAYTIATTPCTNSFSFTDISTGIGGNANYWEWHFGDGTTSSAQNVSHVYNGTGNYNVSLIASTDSGCTDTITQVITVNPVPDAQYNLTIDNCTRLLNAFNNSTGATTYNWYFGDGFTSNAFNTYHNYTSDGTFNVVLIVENDSGCTDTVQQNISFTVLPDAIFSETHGTCDNTVTFTEASVNASGYQWFFGDGNQSSQQNPVNTYALASTYYVTFIASGNGCSDTLIQPLTINPVPVAAYNNPFNCSLTQQFINTSVGGFTYLWSFGDGNTSTDSITSHTYLVPGNYSVILNVTNSFGCIDTASQNVTVQPQSVASFTPAIQNCNPEVSLSNQSTNGFFYLWNFGDGNGSQQLNPIHLYDSAGNYNIRLIVNPGVCADTTSQLIVVTTNPHADASRIEECGLTVNFTNNSRDNTFNLWNFGDGNSSFDIVPNHTYASDTTWQVKLIVINDANCMDTFNLTVRTQLPTIALFDPATDTCEQILSLFNRSEHSNYYLWNLDDGNFSTDKNVVHQYNATGFYNVQLITDPQSVCADTSAMRIYAQGVNESSLFVPSAFSPNGDGSNDEFYVYGYNHCMYYQLLIFNRWGEEIYNSYDLSQGWDGKFNNSDAPAGTYVYILKNATQKFSGAVNLLR